jgi:hypothetical protein
LFLPDGSFLVVPKLASKPFLKLWEQAVFDLWILLEQEPGFAGQNQGGIEAGGCQRDYRAGSQDGAEGVGGVDPASV